VHPAGNANSLLIKKKLIFDTILLFMQLSMKDAMEGMLQR
jgi:hypothetical protein